MIKQYESQYPVRALCQVLQVSRSAYYQWLEAKAPNEENRQLEEQVAEVFTEHKRRYGIRRICAELKEKGAKVGKYKCRRIMQRRGLKAIQPRSFVPRTTQSRHPYAISANLLVGRTPPKRPGQVWVGDITYIPLSEGRWAYLAVWMDRYSRKIVGWQLEAHMREELVIKALNKALNSYGLNREGLIVHSDRGGQYAGREFRRLLEKRKILQSMSRADDPYDNAFAESCFSRLKAELLQGGAFESLEDAHTEIFEYIEMYYNTRRRHSSLDYKSPMEYENQYFYSLT